MSINPIQFTRNAFSGYTEFLMDFIGFQDKSLTDMFKREIAFDLLKGSKLIKGPYIKLNRPFKKGKRLRDLQDSYTIPNLLADKFDFPLYYHQQEAFESLMTDANLVISTGTGSGKTVLFVRVYINHRVD